MRPDQIISGGQDGADQGGLYGARALGIPTGGFAPKGWRTEYGPAPWLADFGLVEHESADYKPRTWANVYASHGTLWVGQTGSPGYYCTEKACKAYRRTMLIVRWPFIEHPINTVENTISVIQEWMLTRKIRVVNIAGNREKKNPGIFRATDALIQLAFQGN